MEPTVQREITIALRSDGSVALDAPLGDKMLCYAMLEMARDIIKDYKPALVTPARAG